MFIGIDWGTNSSKWAAWTGERPNRYRVGGIWPSAVLVSDDKLVFSATRGGTRVVKDVKQEILTNPIAYSFWDAERADTGTTLGELVVFSLCSLIKDALIKDALTELREEEEAKRELEFGFSMPNWVSHTDERSIQAVRNFCEAAAVALAYVESGSPCPPPGGAVSRSTLKDGVRRAIKELGGVEKLARFVPDWKVYAREGPAGYYHNRVKWRFIVESCAAGLPYLRTSLEAARLRKILVVDVGAGSTDVGYMLRTVTRGGTEKLNYFPPAGTLPIAGNDLTRRLVRLYRQRGRQLTEDEAEARKLDPGFTDDWASATQVRDWASSIKAHVAEYVLDVRDRRWLYDGPSLEVALTGGSSVVPGLGSMVLAAVREAMRERDVSARLREATELMNTKLPGLEFDNMALYGRWAVSLGAADPEIPAFRQIESIDPDPGEPGVERFPTRGV